MGRQRYSCHANQETLCKLPLNHILKHLDIFVGFLFFCFFPRLLMTLMHREQKSVDKDFEGGGFYRTEKGMSEKNSFCLKFYIAYNFPVSKSCLPNRFWPCLLCRTLIYTNVNAPFTFTLKTQEFMSFFWSAEVPPTNSPNPFLFAPYE